MRVRFAPSADWLTRYSRRFSPNRTKLLLLSPVAFLKVSRIARSRFDRSTVILKGRSCEESCPGCPISCALYGEVCHTGIVEVKAKILKKSVLFPGRPNNADLPFAPSW